MTTMKEALLYPGLRARGSMTLRSAVIGRSVLLMEDDGTTNLAQMGPGSVTGSSVATCLRWSSGRALCNSTALDLSAARTNRPTAMEEDRVRAVATTAVNSNLWKFYASQTRRLECKPSIVSLLCPMQRLETASRETLKNDSTRGNRPTPDSPHKDRQNIQIGITSFLYKISIHFMHVR